MSIKNDLFLRALKENRGDPPFIFAMQKNYLPEFMAIREINTTSTFVETPNCQ